VHLLCPCCVMQDAFAKRAYVSTKAQAMLLAPATHGAGQLTA
jgi:hypothetical protein